MNNQEMIAVIRAHENGKQIESRRLYKNDPWVAIILPCWNFGTCEYRVKPELKELWVVGELNYVWVYSSRVARANLKLSFNSQTGELIKAEML